MVDVICGSCCTILFTASDLILISGHGPSLRTKRYCKNEKKVKSICAKYTSSFPFHEAFVTSAGELYTHGEDSHGMSGHGNKKYQLYPKLVEALSGIDCKQVDLGSHHVAVLTEEGKVYTFGKGGNGQLGHGDEEDRHVPTLVRALETVEIKEVQCGDYFTMALSRRL